MTLTIGCKNEDIVNHECPVGDKYASLDGGIGTWDGSTIRSADGNIILAGSQKKNGKYQILEIKTNTVGEVIDADESAVHLRLSLRSMCYGGQGSELPSLLSIFYWWSKRAKLSFADRFARWATESEALLRRSLRSLGLWLAGQCSN